MYFKIHFLQALLSNNTELQTTENEQNLESCDTMFYRCTKNPTALYGCTKCEKDFQKISNLQLHMRTHLTKQCFQCSECGQEFTQQGSLKQHALIHAGEWPFQCELCQRKFRRKTALIIHIRRHTGEKPFSCQICESSYRSRRYLKVRF